MADRVLLLDPGASEYDGKRLQAFVEGRGTANPVPSYSGVRIGAGPVVAGGAVVRADIPAVETAAAIPAWLPTCRRARS